MNRSRENSTTHSQRRSWAIVPAAGKSKRMGTAKLLLPVRGKLMIEHVLSAYREARVTATIVVVPPGDTELAECAAASGAVVVVPGAAPLEMKDSVAIALAHLAANFDPQPSDAWLLAPADVPGLSASVVRQLLAVPKSDSPSIVVPVHAGKKGHPTLFPWSLAAEVAKLPPNEGVNALLARHFVKEIECGPPCLASDVDTPEDLRRLQAE